MLLRFLPCESSNSGPLSNSTLFWYTGRFPLIMNRLLPLRMKGRIDCMPDGSLFPLRMKSRFCIELGSSLTSDHTWSTSIISRYSQAIVSFIFQRDTNYWKRKNIYRSAE